LYYKSNTSLAPGRSVNFPLAWHFMCQANAYLETKNSFSKSRNRCLARQVLTSTLGKLKAKTALTCFYAMGRYLNSEHSWKETFQHLQPTYLNMSNKYLERWTKYFEKLGGNERSVDLEWVETNIVNAMKSVRRPIELQGKCLAPGLWQMY
jgi:hypothetical protein